MSVQGVMNTRLGEGIGTMEANCLVQSTAAVLSWAALCFYRTGSFAQLGAVPWYCLLGGALGLVITLTVMLGIGALSPTVAISVIHRRAHRRLRLAGRGARGLLLAAGPGPGADGRRHPGHKKLVASGRRM